MGCFVERRKKRNEKAKKKKRKLKRKRKQNFTFHFHPIIFSCGEHREATQATSCEELDVLRWFEGSK